MRFMIAASLAAAMLAGCASTPTPRPITSSAIARDGNSMASAVVIQAPNESTGVGAEYQWVADRFPGYTPGGQALLNKDGHFYDTLDITTSSGEHRKFYFDITNFFGKL
jgi:hypothetical protein